MKQRKNPADGGDWPEWFLESLAAYRPPDSLTVSECAARHEFVDLGRPYNAELTRYLDGIMDAFTDPEVEEIWIAKPTQVGGTRVILNMLAYIIAHDPADTLIVYPTLPVATYTSKNRIEPMLMASPVLREQYLPQESTDLELHFKSGMVLILAGANSAASLATRPVRYLFFDEIDKYPARTGKESDPIHLGMERVKTFPHNRKVVGTSTPTVTTGNIWRQLESADQVREFFVSCPHCAQAQAFRFRDGRGQRRYLRWNENSTPSQAEDSAWYECQHCHGRILDAHKPQLNRTGEWRTVTQRQPGKRKIGFRFNTLVSPWVRFGAMAREYLASKDDPESLQNFVNSWLGEPWANSITPVNVHLLSERQTPYAEGVLPAEAMLLTGAIDVQRNAELFYWVLRAWGVGVTSWGIAHGMALSWADLEALMNRPWRTTDGRDMLVSLCCVDSGDGNTQDEVYDFCTVNADWAVPVKGASRPMQARFRATMIDKPSSKAHGTRLYIVDTGQYKNMIAARMDRPNGPGSWMLHADCDMEYMEQITSEQKVLDRGTERWEPKVVGGANHYLDCEVYAACAADLMQVRFLMDPAEAEQRAPEQPSQPSAQAEVGREWVRSGRSWL